MSENLEKALKWLSEREVCRGPFGLHRMEFLMERLGNPQRDVPAVLVAGTNGKGSVTSLLDSILSTTPDYLTGSTISPHLVNPLERIRLQTLPMDGSWWCKGVEALKGSVKIMDAEASIGGPSFFELVTALAFWAFRETERDLSLIEVGLGGRLDATNIVSAEISVITNIGTDHQELLGPDKPSIAREKLGILKKKGILITTEDDPEILEIFAKECERKNAQLILVPSTEGQSATTGSMVLRPNNGPKNHVPFVVEETTRLGHRIRLPGFEAAIDFPLPGRHQIRNLSLALAVVRQLRQNHFDIPDEAVARGIACVQWPGRMQWIDGTPSVLLDGAHNQEGLASLIEYLKEFPMPRPCHLVLGALKNKPAAEMARQLAPFADTLAFVPPTTNRALGRSEFEEQIRPHDKNWEWYDHLEHALEAGKDAGSIFLTGSLYLVADFFRLRGHVFPPPMKNHGKSDE